MELVIASNNQGKIKEIRQILGDYFDNIYSLEDLNIVSDVEETGRTFLDNALIKANAVRQFTDLPILADDSGLEVEALNGAPGVFSARYAGTPSSDALNNIKLLNSLKGVVNRRAQFRSVTVLLLKGHSMLVGEGICRGEILKNYSGTNGFGYDPLFFSYDIQKSFALATDEEKNSASHRARALNELLRLAKKNKILRRIKPRALEVNPSGDAVPAQTEEQAAQQGSDKPE